MEDRDLPGDADREGPGATQLIHRMAIAHKHIRRRSGRRGLASIERHDLARRKPEQHEATAAEA